MTTTYCNTCNRFTPHSFVVRRKDWARVECQSCGTRKEIEEER